MAADEKDRFIQYLGDKVNTYLESMKKEMEEIKAELSKERSRWIKTSLRNILDGDLLFVDTDTIICGDLSGIDYQDSELAITLDLHSRFNEHPYKKSIENKIGFVSPERRNEAPVCCTAAANVI